MNFDARSTKDEVYIVVTKLFILKAKKMFRIKYVLLVYILQKRK